MFSRRHPYLYSFLIFSGIFGFSAVAITLLISGSLSREWKDSEGGEHVGIVEVEGAITDGSTCLKELKQFRKNKDVKAIVLRIDSPGGAIGPSQEIYREVMKTKSVKPVIASMGTLAASGGYYIASGATGIMANPGTITGSIGVIMEYANVEQLLSKIGLSPVVIKSGKLKDAGSPLRAMTKEEVDYLQNFVSKLHSQFISDVAKGRGMEEAGVINIADGRILSGSTAQELGLVDRMGNLEDAVEWAGKEGGIEGEIAVEYAHKRRIPLVNYFLKEAVQLVIDHMDALLKGIEYR
jgi:protease IV